MPLAAKAEGARAGFTWPLEYITTTMSLVIVPKIVVLFLVCDEELVPLVRVMSCSAEP